MERLTWHNGEEWTQIQSTKVGSRAIYEKLAAYEDTELTPEEVQELVEKKKKGELVEPPVECKDCCYSWRNDGQADASNWAPCQRGWSPNEDDFCSYGERIK